MNTRAIRNKNCRDFSRNWLSAVKFVEKRKKSALALTNCDLYHYAGNNPVKYTDPDGRTGENGLDGIAAFRLEDPIQTGTVPLYNSKTGKPILDEKGNQQYIKDEIDTVLGKSGDFLYGDYDGANRLKDEWGPTIQDDVGTPDEWNNNYNTDVQYSLRKYLKDSFVEYQKMKLLMFRTGAM